jgi:hypothetical protein
MHWSRAKIDACGQVASGQESGAAWLYGCNNKARPRSRALSICLLASPLGITTTSDNADGDAATSNDGDDGDGGDASQSFLRGSARFSVTGASPPPARRWLMV